MSIASRAACAALLCSALIAPLHGYAQPSVDADPTSAASLGLTELTHDLSRQELFSEFRKADERGGRGQAARAREAIETFNLQGSFTFPEDTTYDTFLRQPRTNSYFGVDISHYTPSSFPIELLAARNIQFLYMKATQGNSGLDGKFSSFWKRAGALTKGRQVHRGAYHFLSACEGSNCHVAPAEWGKAQADTFIKVIQANGRLLPTDMPPTVDLEPDRATKSSPDRWEYRTPAEIVTLVDAFLNEVQSKLHRSAIIYTNRRWWNQHIRAVALTPTMQSTPLWLADYSKSSRGSEDPPTIRGRSWALWQFTESATMAGNSSMKFDANIYKGPLSALYQSLGVEEFAP